MINIPNVPIRSLGVFIELGIKLSSLNHWLLEISPLLPDQISSNVVLHLIILGKKIPLWENFNNFEKAWWNSYKKWLLANKAEAKRREKRPSKTAPAKIQGQFSLFQYCKRPLRWGQSTLALLWARGLKGHDAWKGFSTAKTAGMF